MRKYLTIALLFLIMAFIVGCAASYTRISPEVRKYKMGDSTSAISMMYKYDVLSLKGNKRYAKLEAKAGISVVAIKISNHTDSTLYTSRMKIFFGTKEVIPLNAFSASQMLKQGVVIYLLYSLLGLYVATGPSNTYGQTHYTVIPIGIPIAAGNMLGAGAANTNLRNEFLKYDISDRIIKPGQDLFAIVSLKEITHEPLRVEFH
jgi:hypothetical protein